MVNWVIPTEKTLRREYHVEVELKGMEDLFDGYRDFRKKVDNAKIVSLSRSLDRTIDYRSHTRSQEELLNLIRMYRSYPEFRNEDTVQHLYDTMKEGGKMDMPIVLDFGDRKRVLAGNTRLDVAFQSGVIPKVLMLDMSSSYSESRSLVNKVLSGEDPFSLVSYISESLNKAYPWKFVHPQIAEFKVADGSKVEVVFEDYHLGTKDEKSKPIFEVSFSRKKDGFLKSGTYKINKTGEGYQLPIFATILSIIKSYIKKNPLAILFFSSAKSDINRSSLYARLLRRYASKIGRTFTFKQYRSETIFVLFKKGDFNPEDIDEFFIPSLGDKIDKIRNRRKSKATS